MYLRRIIIGTKDAGNVRLNKSMIISSTSVVRLQVMQDRVLQNREITWITSPLRSRIFTGVSRTDDERSTSS